MKFRQQDVLCWCGVLVSSFSEKFRIFLERFSLHFPKNFVNIFREEKLYQNLVKKKSQHLRFLKNILIEVIL
jgi:hypothetical protein